MTTKAIVAKFSNSIEYILADYKRILLVLTGLAYVIVYAGTYNELLSGPWDTEQDGHGPFIVLVTLGLIISKASSLEFNTTKINEALLGVGILFFGVLLFVLGNSQSYLIFDAGSQIPILIGLTLVYFGMSGFNALWFPILFLAFSVPLPGWLLDAFTQPMKLYLSEIVTASLYYFEYPIAQNGVVLYIGQYQLLVKDACVGLNSIFSLCAVGVLYIYLVKPKYVSNTLLLLALIFPASFVANYLRVCLLVLVTYYLGDAAGQGFLHDFSGIVMFTSALLVFLLADFAFLAAVRLYQKRRANT